MCRLAGQLQSAEQAVFETCLVWLLRVTEAVLSTYTQAIASCQNAAIQPTLQQDYEQARQLYLQRLLDLAVSYGELSDQVQRFSADSVKGADAHLIIVEWPVAQKLGLPTWMPRS